MLNLSVTLVEIPYRSTRQKLSTKTILHFRILSTRNSATLSAIGTHVPSHERDSNTIPGPLRINRAGDSSRTRCRLRNNAKRVVKMDVK